MNAALTYPEPYRFSAGMLALAVHLLFFFVLYFGFRWQAQPPEQFMVEMWDSLPEVEVTPEQLPAPPERVEPKPVPKVVAPVLPPVKADIEIRDKKKQAEAKAKAAAEARAKQDKERRELDRYAAQRAASLRQEQARIRAEVDAATATQVGRYQDMIRAKIRSKIIKQDVPPTAEATFEVTLLPGGEVMEAELIKSSGYAAYDDAVERAIRRASPLPIPSDTALQRMFRKLKLTFRPE